MTGNENTTNSALLRATPGWRLQHIRAIPIRFARFYTSAFRLMAARPMTIDAACVLLLLVFLMALAGYSVLLWLMQ